MTRSVAFFRRLLLLVGTGMNLPASLAGVWIGIQPLTIGDDPHHLLVSYTADANYDTPDRHTWNGQVFTLRWPTGLGAAVVAGVTNLSEFDFAPDGPPQAGGDGFYYQKFSAAGYPVTLAMAAGQQTEVLSLSLAFSGEISWVFELVSEDLPGVAPQHGLPNVENASLSDQFLGFDPAVAVHMPTATEQPAAAAGWKVMPNPTTGPVSVILEAPAPADWRVCILTPTGQCLRAETRWLPGGTNRFPMDLSGLPPGVYLLRIQAPFREMTLPLLLFR